MLNKVLLIGRLTQDPDLRYTANGIPVAKFGLAVDRSFKKQDGTRETDFIDIVAWRQRAEFASNYLSKGRQVFVEGSLQISSFTGQDGVKRRRAEVHVDNFAFVGPRPGDTEREAPGEETPPSPGGSELPESPEEFGGPGPDQPGESGDPFSQC